MEKLKVGGEVQAYCTTCRTMSEHLIVALVAGRPAKVECDTCHKQHAYRAAAPGVAKEKSESSSTTAAKPRRAAGERSAAGGRSAAPPRQTVDLEARLAGHTPRAYDPQARYNPGDAVRHPSFGVGSVMQLPGPQKMEVAFSDGLKLLSHDRAAATAPTLARPAPRSDDGERRASDAPPDRPRL